MLSVRSRCRLTRTTRSSEEAVKTQEKQDMLTTADGYGLVSRNIDRYGVHTDNIRVVTIIGFCSLRPLASPACMHSPRLSSIQ